MIFNAATTTALVLDWQSTKDPDTLAQIMENSRKLIEAIVSQYPLDYRDDLIQEAYNRLQYSLPYYNSQFSIHNYFTTVIHNTCRTYISKQNRYSKLFADFEILYETGVEDDYAIDEDLLTEVKTRNRKRFFSLSVTVSDAATEYIISSLKADDVFGKSRGIVGCLVSQYGMSRNIANAFYHSTIIFLRKKFISNAKAPEDKDMQYSLLYDLRLELGDAAFDKIRILFSGMTFRIP